MKLTAKDIETLHYHINAKQIPYIEVRDEVLDHYQTALELEQERPMKEVLAELDETFTEDYCKYISGKYLQNLKQEYPLQFKEELLDLFSWNKFWIPMLALGFVLLLPIFVPKTGVLIHLFSIILGLSTLVEQWLIARNYPNNEQKHHYLLIDKKPIFAHTKADTLKGFTTLYLACYLIVVIPLIVIYFMEGSFENNSIIVFQPPYIYATVFSVWIFLVMMIVRTRAKVNLSKPQLS